MLVLGMLAAGNSFSRNYDAVIDSAVRVTEAYIYNSDLLKGEPWQKFKKEIKAREYKDAGEFQTIWNTLSRELPFTHYFLLANQKQSAAAPDRKNQGGEEPIRKFKAEEVRPGTVLLRIKDFSGSAREAVEVVNELKRQQPQQLIVDLRGNPGGSIAAALPLARYLASDTIYGGIFLTRKYFDRHYSLPKPEEYLNFPLFNEANFDLFISSIHRMEGMSLVVIPEEGHFRGKLYVLTDKGTASTCEPLVYGLKASRTALLVGENTAGAMLSGEFFDLGPFRLFLPTADYYTADGTRLDKKGVAPDVEVPSQQALEKTLGLIGSGH